MLHSNYLFLFFDSFASALILPIRSEMVVYAMSIFGQYNSHLIFLITLSASVSGSLLTWFLGKKLQFLKNTGALKNKNSEIKNAEGKWDKYVVWLLIFSPLKILGNPLSLLAGFLNTSFRKFFCLIFVSKFIYYFWIIYFSNSV
jgi:membrane protein YqaA with SNARE-associated domain